MPFLPGDAADAQKKSGQADKEGLKGLATMPRRNNPSLLSIKSANRLIRVQAQTRLAQDASQIDFQGVSRSIIYAGRLKDADQPGPNTTALKRDALSFHGIMEHDPTKRWAEAAVAATTLSAFALMALPTVSRKVRRGTVSAKAWCSSALWCPSPVSSSETRM